MLNFEKIKNNSTIVGGVKGKTKVILTDFDVKADRNNNPNYQFKLSLVDYPGKTKQYNCGESFYPGVVSNIASQLGFEEGALVGDIDVLTKASTDPFYIWIIDGIVYFYDREEYLKGINTTEPAITADDLMEED